MVKRRKHRVHRLMAPKPQLRCVQQPLSTAVSAARCGGLRFSRRRQFLNSSLIKAFWSRVSKTRDTIKVGERRKTKTNRGANFAATADAQ